MPSDSGGPQRSQSRPFRVQENQELPFGKVLLWAKIRFTRPLSLSSRFGRSAMGTSLYRALYEFPQVISLFPYTVMGSWEG